MVPQSYAGVRELTRQRDHYLAEQKKPWNQSKLTQQMFDMLIEHTNDKIRLKHMWNTDRKAYLKDKTHAHPDTVNKMMRQHLEQQDQE